MNESFAVEANPALWSSLEMNVERFSNVPPMLSNLYQDIFLSQDNRPLGMAYFDEMIRSIYSGRIEEVMAGIWRKSILLDTSSPRSRPMPPEHGTSFQTAAQDSM